MALRILAGKYKGRILKTPKGSSTRPTTSLVRKALFDRIRPFLEESHILDLFAGSGAIGIEALSQGAAYATFVEIDPNALRALTENLKNLHITRAAVLKGDAVKTLEKLAKKQNRFDIIYIDPPYKQEPLLIPPLLELIDTTTILQKQGYLFIEEGEPTDWSHLPLKYLKLTNTRHYGITTLHTFRH